MRMGLGLGLGHRRGKPSSSPENTIKTAIKERMHIRAVRDGVGILVQPYALVSAGGSRILHGVIVAVEGDAVGGWDVSEVDISTLSGVEVYDIAFIPSDAFDIGSLDGVIAVVEPFDPFQDAGEDSAGTD